MFKLKTIFLHKTQPQLVFRFLSSTAAPSISQIFQNNKAGDVIQVQGWVKSLRDQKENVFLDLGDGSSEQRLQIFLPKTLKSEKLSAGASIKASGALKLSPKGNLELAADNIEVCGDCVISEGYPFAPRKKYAPDYIRQYLHLRPRTNRFAALLRVRNTASLAIHSYFFGEGFCNIHTPILTSNDCEGAGEVFKVTPESEAVLKAMLKPGQKPDEVYFNQKSFLTVSGQMHLEAAAHGLSKVYTFGPTFRAENSRSRLHLSEFYMLETEIAFIDRIESLMEAIEKLIKSVTIEVLHYSIADMQLCQENEADLTWINKDFPVLSFEEACDILKNSQLEVKTSEGFTKEQELFLVKHCGNVPVFVINWPKAMKPFYMKEIEQDKVAALDLLAPNVGEIIGGSLREQNYELLKAKIPENLDWYLELRKFGSVPTAGFGLGFERYLQFILGIANIKDTIPFPRWPHNCSM